MTYRLGFTGDVMLGRQVDRHQRHRPDTAVWGNLKDRLRCLDGLFINLECCLSTRGTKWDRTYRPFHFRADPDWAISALEAVSVDFAALANNHLMDFGEVALIDTVDTLDEAGIGHAGAGRDFESAWTPASISIDRMDLGVLAVTDNTPEYAAGDDSPGVAHAEVDHTDETVRTRYLDAIGAIEADNPDLMVASLHWGPNMVERPPEEFRAFAHWLVDQGVDIVHGHSAHIFQGVETYEGSLILYDTGDFVDDYAVDDELRNDRSFLFELEVSEHGGLKTLRLFPTEIYDYAVHEADAAAAEWSRGRMRELSAEFGTEFDRRGDSLVLPIDDRSTNS